MITIERMKSRVKVDLQTGCWNWTGYRDPKGYGQIDRRYIPGLGWLLAHRVMYELSIGPIPPRMLVLHKCDNPSCINPEHLATGTPKDNSRDMVVRGRSLKGSKHKMAILSEADVTALRIAFRNRTCDVKSFCAEAAERYGLAASSVVNVVYGYNWKHVPE